MGYATYAVLSCLSFVVIRHLLNKSRPPCPPGPTPLPVIGNVHQFPHKDTAATFLNWKKQYGDMIYLSMLGKPMLVLNSHKACADLLDNRSSTYSDRPRMIMLLELMQFDWQFALMPYSARWRQHRRLFHQFFNENVVPDYRGVQEASTHTFLRHLLTDPENFFDHIRLNFADTILQIMYGIKLKSVEDNYLRVVEIAIEQGLEASKPGRYLVELFPFLKHVPSWMPGAGSFHRDIAAGRVKSKNVREVPASYVEKSMGPGAESSVLAKMLERCEGIDGANVARSVASMAYIGGSDTTLSSIQTLFMVLANYPEVQREAQAEIDAVIGGSRLPTFADMDELPYIGAVMKEILRWHTVLPLGLPHCTSEGDVYEGYFIPKRTVVLPNMWAILHDPEVYTDPLVFNPSRWLIKTEDGLKENTAIPHPDIAAFGFGRRICPGRYLAHNALFIVISNVLACFSISPTEGASKVPEVFKEGLLVYPERYKVSIVPRSEKALQLLKEIDV